MFGRSRKISAIILILFSIGMVSAFQNCGESMDLSQYKKLDLSSQGTPVAFISKQTASFNADENTNQDLSVEITNGTISEVDWYKDNQKLSASASATFSFQPIKKSDEGTYIAKIFLADGSELDSEPIVVTVKAAPVQATYTSVTMTYQNQTYYMFYYDNNASANKTGQDAFCKYKLGSAATEVSSTAATNPFYIYRFFFATSQTGCSDDPYHVAYVNGFCLGYASSPFYSRNITSLTCTSN